MDKVRNFIVFFEESVDDGRTFFIKVLATILLLLGVHLITKAINKYVDDRADKSTTTVTTVRFTRLAASLISFFIIFYIWFSSFRGIGIIAAVLIGLLALAVKDILVDIVAFFYIAIRKPFALQDTIEIDGIAGTVVDIDILEIHMEELGQGLSILSPTGRYVTLPNRFIFDKAVFNYSHDHNYLKQEVSVLIDFDQDREAALKLAGQVAYERYSKVKVDHEDRELKIFDRDLEGMGADIKPQIWCDIDPNGFRIHVLYFTPIKDVLTNRRLMELGLYDAFKTAGIHMPAPQYVRISE